MKPCRARGEEGVVLLLVLVLIVLTISSVYAFARDAFLEVTRIRERSERARAELLARSGEEIARRTLADDATVSVGDLQLMYESSLDPWALLAHEVIRLPDGGEIRLSIRDSGSRINLNGLVDLDGNRHGERSLSFLRALLEHVIDEMPGRTEEKLYQPAELAEAILDWIDSDEVTRFGDERVFYGEQGSGARPLDRPLIALRELESVPGMDERLLDALEHYFTIYPMFPAPSRVGVNPNTAPAHVMAVIWADEQLLGRDDVFRALSRRAQGRIFCASQAEGECESFAEEILELQTPFPPLRYGSSVFEIESEGYYGGARVRIVATVDRSDPADIITLHHRMN